MIRAAAIASFAALFTASASLAESDAASAFAERARILAIDDACGILTGPERLAMEAGRLQTRNALIRAGYPDDAVLSLEDRQAALDEDACFDNGLVEINLRVSNAFDAWRRLKEMSYPAERRTWRAFRPDDYDGPRWRVRQAAPKSAWFGVTSHRGSARLTFAAPPDEGSVRAVRLIVRDPAKAGLRDVGELARLLPAGSAPRTELDARVAPPALSKVYWAGNRLSASAADAAALGAAEGLELFAFSHDALVALEQLDARDVVAVEVEGRDATQRHVFEVGDFLSAEIFAFIND